MLRLWRPRGSAARQGAIFLSSPEPRTLNPFPLLIVLIGLFLVSCQSLPSLPPEQARRLPVAYDQALPASFNAQQTLVFEFKPHWWWPTIRMTALGYATVNRKTGDYAVVCLTPMGMKLFDVSCSNGVATTRMTIPSRGDPAIMGKAISDDIGSLYFDLAPAPGAEVKQRGQRVIFRSASGEHEYNAVSGELIRKVVRTPDTRSTLTFSDYRQGTGLAYPETMTLRNHNNRYRLTVRTLKLTPLP